MTKLHLTSAALGVALLLVAACFVDIPDVGPVGDEASVDAPSNDVYVPPTCDASACGAPTGFVPVLFDTSRSSSCPTGTTTRDVVANPGAPPADACGCTCSITQQPSCVPTSVTVHFDNGGGTCGNTSTYNASGGCDSVNYALAQHAMMLPPSPSDAGACTSAPVTDAGAVPRTSSRLCMPTVCGAACAPSGSFKACVAAAGNVPCPSNTVAVVVGDDVSVSCSCATCSVVSVACAGNVDMYSDTNCSALVYAAPIGGPCVAQTGAGAAIKSARYSPTVTASCDAGSATGVSAKLTNPQTICCPP